MIWEHISSKSNFSFSDFDECANSNTGGNAANTTTTTTPFVYHDCSEHAHCFNLRGSYTCSCRDGYADVSANPVYPGRHCSAEPMGCERCHYHGSCSQMEAEDGDGFETTTMAACRCFQWYAGSSCHINLKGLFVRYGLREDLVFNDC